MSAPTPRGAGGARQGRGAPAPELAREPALAAWPPTDARPGGRAANVPHPARRRRPPSGVLVRRWAVALAVVALSIDLAVRAVQDVAGGSDRATAPAGPANGGALTRSAAGPALPGPAVRWGMHGRAVETLQAALSLLGYDPGRADGAFAAGTRTAVTAFQRDSGMVPDGIVVEETARRLRSALARRARTDAQAAARGLQTALTAGRLTNGEVQRANATLARAERVVAEAPLERAAPVAAVLRDVAAAPSAYDRPRVTALWGTLSMNLRPWPAGMPRDVTGPGGVVYRWMPGEGYQFHPLANFALLNAEVSHGERDRARLLAGGLLARGARDGGGMVWEYDFPFGGPLRWTSGFAQAVAADGLARAGRMLDDRRLTDAAREAFNALDPALTRPIAGGRWILEYSSSDMLVLNADLESLLSLRRYAATSGSARATRLADQLDTALHRLLPRFDTGCWSRYSLGGAPASRSYHAYHVQLLRRLFSVTGDPLWRRYADRFGRDLRAPSC
jgi:peptidoglycan hydrolase-like protein with peptidoglycan-binding domain